MFYCLVKNNLSHDIGALLVLVLYCFFVVDGNIFSMPGTMFSTPAIF